MIGKMTTPAEYDADRQDSPPFRILLIEDGVTTQLADYLPYECYVISQKSTPRPVNRLFSKHDVPDAVIGSASPMTLRHFERIVSHYHVPLRPVLVVVSDTPTTAFVEFADLCVPAQPQWVTVSLSAALTRRAEQIALHEAWKEEKNNQRRAAHELELTKETIVRNVSHELRTPLLIIKGAIEKLDRTAENENPLNAAAQATARLEGLISNLTQFARGLHIQLDPMYPHESVQRALMNLRNRWDYQQHLPRIDVHVEEGLPLVLGDSAGISNALQLLVENALKFSDDRVEVRAERTDEGVRFSVRDSGIGIPRNQRTQIFEPFYQVDSSLTRPYEGLGIGLSIVRFILDGHRVPCKVTSRKGKGSEFSFVLPEFSEMSW